MQYWTQEMEKQVGERVQLVLSDPQLLSVYRKFGDEALRRSSVFHGLGKFLAEQNVSGKLCFEIGTWNALTSVILARHFERVVTVDIAHNALKHEVIKHLGIKNIRCFDIASNEDKAKVAMEFDFDFAYLDGDHAHDTESDFELTKRCRRILMHEAWPWQRPVWDLIHRLPREQIVFGGSGLALWDGQ